jgi:exonuclease SbcC
MIPIRLALRNFMPYRDNVPPLYFDGIHTACICGDNGNGKSAIIDAMTWAVWGQARAKSDDELIHSGQAETYRVIRKHSRPKRRGASGKSILEFQVATGDGFRAITGDSITRTQQKIISVLHMDYDTFINSAYLRQGRADEFTRQSPSKRKEVLGNILGLSLYDELEEQARESAKMQESQKTQLEASIREIDAELAQKPAWESSFEQAQKGLSSIEKSLKEQESRLNNLRQEKDALENVKLQLNQLNEHIAETERDVERWEEQVKQHRSRVQEYESLIARRSAIEEGYDQFVATRKRNEELEQRFRLVAALNDRKHRLEMAVMKAGENLLTEHAVAENRVKELEASAGKLAGLKNDLQQVQGQQRQLSEQEGALLEKRQAGVELQAAVADLQSGQARLELDIAEIGEKLKLLSAQTETKCPLCESELGMDGVKLIEAKYAAERGRKSEELALKRVDLARKKEELESLAKEVSREELRLNQAKASVQNRAGVIGKAISDADEAGSKLDQEKERLAQIEERLAKRDFATVEQKALQQIENELTALVYDPQQHEEIRQRLANFQQYEEPKRKLEEADRLIDQERESTLAAEETARQRRLALEANHQKRQELITRLGALPQLNADFTRAESEFQSLTLQQRQSLETVFALKAKLERCTVLETNKKDKENLLTQAAKEESIYNDLTEAFGRRGIQALLIEAALPEVENEANKLLARMTDNRMHLKIETQRETKKGDIAETLDINISDELGTRNYEMFSGGEAFRINFAIRIALSKMLARRAGAPLPTLIIDEGFGTQDNAGLEKLKEAINSIHDDFDKILVITHVDELKDAFPARIDVVKTPQGSTISLS